MIISSIMKRYSNDYNSALNIVTTPCDNKHFLDFLYKALPDQSCLLSLEDTLFGHLSIDMIICHNKINYLEKCANLSYFLHCPILIIDHDTKPGFLNTDIIDYQSNCIYSIGLNNSIYNSWGRKHNMVMEADINNKDHLEQWRTLLYQITKIPFNMKPQTFQQPKINHHE